MVLGPAPLLCLKEPENETGAGAPENRIIWMMALLLLGRFPSLSRLSYGGLRRDATSWQGDAMFGPETLLLFDIDGTLLGGMPPTHRQAICDAARHVFDLSI